MEADAYEKSHLYNDVNSSCDLLREEYKNLLACASLEAKQPAEVELDELKIGVHTQTLIQATQNLLHLVGKLRYHSSFSSPQ